ncbi:MAG: CDP-diacylglycerol--glycerol-3-phosphate 3-phosphatidyltransferase [Alphaproteobacteria bacterium]|nr:CDP-diacylglycerol--glycerol-3-phosphate 3-phosphatidyltransferase [Alphaproteobacteria bacterium]
MLTISRIVVIPLIFLSVYIDCKIYTYFAGVLFVIASITDYYDGKIARARGIVSAFGRLLDPIADKLLVATALIVFVAKKDVLAPVSIIPVFVILCRELLVSGLREFLREVNVGLPVTRLAKWKTGFQMVSLGMIFFDGWFVFGQLGEILLWVAGVLTFITGYQYFQKSMEYIKAENKESENPKKEVKKVENKTSKPKTIKKQNTKTKKTTSKKK